jgi:hypothetical protein
MLEGRGYRDSAKQDSNRQEYSANRKSHSKYTLPPNSGDNILL